MLSRSIFSFSAIACIVLSVVNAAPIQTSYSQLHVPEAGFLLTESLSEYYENIVDQVMLDVSENVLSYIPKSISQGDVEVRQLAQKSLNRNLNFMRASLLASVNPLVSTDIPQIAGLTTIQNEATKLSEEINQHTEEMESLLLESILTLNKKISHQLGLIVNAEQSSAILIRQANTAQRTRQENKPTVITVEWKLRQPFQINVLREEQETTNNDIVLLESEWLFDQLSLVEENLLTEFDDRTQEAIQLVMESLALDI
ncbi:hypothetical protein INT47_009101 [Mucor saturninus]|uniref:Uncharacterized protein n=1 Tax=Mucor saturninus TaxID=64648 RepID=A0A8H7VC71_9FUNG|nr:hypothetical protein INT47_009101 [Mucor saturninus]